MVSKEMNNSDDIFVVENFEEAQQFRYVYNDQPVEVGTAVGVDRPFVGMPGDKPPAGGWPKLDRNNPPVMQLVCFEDIYFQSEE